MKNRALLIAIVLVQCKGETAPAPSPAPPAPAAAVAPAGTDTGPGPTVGAPLPAFEAPDQEGRRQSFDTLRGPNGLLLNFNRSVVWWPYCKSQLVELASQMESFRKRGLGVASVIPEPVETIRQFTAKHGITYPVLSDSDAAIIRRFGLVDRGFQATGDLVGKDIPFAATFLVDAQGRIQEKFFEAAAENRRTTASILVLQGEPGTGGQEVRGGHFTLRTSSSNVEVAPGQRFTLVLDFEMEPKHHSYAPGVKGYRPLELQMDPDPLFEFHPTRFPPPRDYYFAPLKETVPVFEGKFRVTRDVTVTLPGALPRFKDTDQIEAAVSGTLRYQVCSDTVCYPPSTLPLKWTVRVRRWVR